MKKLNIALIDPKGVVKELNAGLGYLASILAKEGHNVKVVDLNNYEDNEKERLRRIIYSDIIGISIKTSTIKEGLRIAKFIKNNNKNVILICGGPHIKIDGYDFMKENNIFDIGVIGEGEQVFIDIIKNKKRKEIDGIIYRENKEIKINPLKERIKDLNKLPFPAYHLFDSIHNEINNYPIVTSRGCPYDCNYCSVPNIMGKK